MNKDQPRSTLQRLFDTMPQTGRLEWIGTRPGRDQPVQSLEWCRVLEDSGMEGDHFGGRSGAKRSVTLIQSEHLQVIAAILQRESLTPEMLRRNLMVSGINLLALKDRCFSIGDVELQMTGYCHPCSKMERVLGPGGYNALRGHGGITAAVLRGGIIRTGDTVSLLVDFDQ